MYEENAQKPTRSSTAYQQHDICQEKHTEDSYYR